MIAAPLAVPILKNLKAFDFDTPIGSHADLILVKRTSQVL
jgi:hypothetical protein